MSIGIPLAVVISTELLQTDPSIMVRVNTVNQVLSPFPVMPVVRKSFQDLVNREKAIMVFVRSVLKKDLPVLLLRRGQGDLSANTISADVPVTGEADKTVCSHVPLWQRLVGGWARLAGPCALPGKSDTLQRVKTLGLWQKKGGGSKLHILKR